MSGHLVDDVPAVAAGHTPDGQPKPVVKVQLPARLGQPGTLVRCVNVTGLIADETLLGDELALMYPPADVARSSLAAFTGWRWNGERFAAPAGG